MADQEMIDNVKNKILTEIGELFDNIRINGYDQERTNRNNLIVSQTICNLADAYNALDTTEEEVNDG